MTRLDDDEENVNFIEMFNKFHTSKERTYQNQIQSSEPEGVRNSDFYPQQNMESNTERVSQMDPQVSQNYHLMQQANAKIMKPPPAAGKSIRPSSANVQNQGRFL